jgi:DNA-directed RNA polymerase specialized sigma24 family protein
LAEDYSDWKPSLRVVKTPEERAKEALGNLPPEVREAVLAQFQNM